MKQIIARAHAKGPEYMGVIAGKPDNDRRMSAASFFREGEPGSANIVTPAVIKISSKYVYNKKQER